MNQNKEIETTFYCQVLQENINDRIDRGRTKFTVPVPESFIQELIDEEDDEQKINTAFNFFVSAGFGDGKNPTVNKALWNFIEENGIDAELEDSWVANKNEILEQDPELRNSWDWLNLSLEGLENNQIKLIFTDIDENTTSTYSGNDEIEELISSEYTSTDYQFCVVCYRGGLWTTVDISEPFDSDKNLWECNK